MKGLYIIKINTAFVTCNGKIYSCYSNLQDRYWFKQSKKIITSVINRLEDVHISSDQPDQQKNLTKLVDKLRTDCLQLIEIAIQKLNKEINETQSTDESETEISSEERNNESDNKSRDVYRNKSSNALENGKEIGDRYDDKKETFRLLLTCTLILETESGNFSNINNFIKEKN